MIKRKDINDMAEITEEDRLKQLEVLKVSYGMYEDSKKKTEKRMKTALTPEGTKKFTEKDIQEEMALLEEAQKEVVSKYELFGGDPNDLIKKSTKKKTTKQQTIMETMDDADAILKEREQRRIKEIEQTQTIVEKEYAPEKTSETRVSYDVIPLPSNGECYRQKTSRLPVAYLTAYDENMIIAPNLYRDNKIIDLILKEKILNNTIDPADLLEGDRDAIILFLRASGYGNEYPITATDNETGEKFDAVIDLSQLKFKDFKLKGDENGWFDFTLPISQKNVKFKFLTHRDIQRLDNTEMVENKKLQYNKIDDMLDVMNTFIDTDDDMDKAKKIKIRQALATIEEWRDEVEEEDALDFTHNVTNRLELSIMAVDNITDRKYIRDFVRNMNVKDSSALRRYISANEPGIDYNITIEKPASLGGGSMSVFLQLDQYIFLNIA